MINKIINIIVYVFSVIIILSMPFIFLFFTMFYMWQTKKIMLAYTKSFKLLNFIEMSTRLAFS